MKKYIDLNFVLCAVTILVFISYVCHAQPDIPMEKIPHNISSNINNEIKKLYSKNPKIQSEAIITLGILGDEAAPAVPFLIAMFNNCLTVQLNHGTFYENTNVCQIAATALGKIGNPAVDSLIAALNDINLNPRGYAAFALGEIKDIRAVEPLIRSIIYGSGKDNSDWAIRKSGDALKKITGKDFGVDHNKWQAWWDQNKTGTSETPVPPVQRITTWFPSATWEPGRKKLTAES